MAEAARTDKSGARTGAIHTAYLESPTEIGQALITLRNQRAPLQITFENEATVHSARILDVLESEMLLEDLQPRSGLALMSARRTFALSARAAGLYLYSERNRVSRIDEDQGVPYFRVPFPDSVLFQQRRRAPRYEVQCRVGNTPPTVTLVRSVPTDPDHGDTVEGVMLDISAGGCRLSIPGPVHPQLESDEVLASMVIRIPGRFDLYADGAIRHATYNKITRKVICGIEFTGMHVTDRRRLDRFLRSLDRLCG